MRKVVVSEFLSLDGVMHEPMWTFPYWNDQMAKFKQEELFSSDTLLLGRVTYDGFAQAWPGRTDEEGYADRINNMPKYVVSTTLEKADWNNTSIIKDKVVDQIMKLKEQPGQNILVFGSGALIQTLIQHELIDEYRLQVYPLVLGKGQKLFLDGNSLKLKLAESHTFTSGVTVLIYQPDRED